MMPATSAHDEEEQEGILTKKKRPSRSGWGKVEKTRKEASIRFWRCPILQKSNCPPSQLTKFWASPAAASQCSPSSHQLDWVTQDTMRRTGNQRSPNNLDPRSSPSFNFLPNLSSSVCFPQLYPARATLTVHFFAQSHPSHPMAPLYFKLRFFYSGFWSTAVHWVSALPLLFSFSSIVYQKNVFFSIIFYSFIFCWM